MAIIEDISFLVWFLLMSFPAVASFSGLQLHNVPMKEKQIAFVMGGKKRSHALAARTVGLPHR